MADPLTRLPGVGFRHKAPVISPNIIYTDLSTIAVGQLVTTEFWAGFELVERETMPVQRLTKREIVVGDRYYSRATGRGGGAGGAVDRTVRIVTTRDEPAKDTTDSPGSA